ncbi:MAG: lytic transglycosylase domain-containing protein [Desulfobulbaceae bacterium]
MRRFGSILGWLVLVTLFIPVGGSAAIYVYVDERGVKHYTNTPTSSRYRLATLRRLNTPPGQGGREVERGRAPSVVKDPTDYDHHIRRAAEAYRIDPLLIKAIIKAESGFNQYATSSKGAQGLMQLMPETSQDLRVDNPFSAAENIDGGTRYLRKLLDAYGGDVIRSIAAYNAGPGRVSRKGPLPMIRETRDYVRKVTAYYQQYRDMHTRRSSVAAR